MADENKPTVEQAAWVVEKLGDHFRNGGTFGYLVHKRMGYNGKGDYEALLCAGGLFLSNIAFDYQESKKPMSPCGKHERRYWVEDVTPDPDHAPPDDPDHVSIASYCALCVIERIIAERGALLEACKNLLDACYTADAREELGPSVDGSLLDALRAAIAAAEKGA